MKHISIEKHIEHIVNASKDGLYYLCTRTGHMSNNQNFPVIVAYAQTSGLIDYEDIDNKTARTFDVSISMLEKQLKPELVDDGKGGKVREDELSFKNRVKTRREEMILILEQIIHYLTDDYFPFRYEVLTDIDYAPVTLEDNAYGLQGMQATTSFATGFIREHCCVDFDEDAIKNYQKKNYQKKNC